MLYKRSIVVAAAIQIIGFASVACAAATPIVAPTDASSPSKTDLQRIQSLFAEATNSAIMRDGFPRLVLLCSASTSAAAPASEPSVDGQASRRLPASPTSKSAGPATLPSEGTLFSKSADAASPAQALVQAVDQFNRDWKQKYGRDFRVSDPSLVFADITAADLLTGGAELAAGHVAGTLTKASITVPAEMKLDINSNEIAVNVPPVMGSRPAVAHLVRVGGAFRFAGNHGVVDSGTLAGAIQAQLKALSAQKDHWPIDAALSQRLVTQHIIMAIEEVTHKDKTSR